MAISLRILRKPEVLEREGFANSTLYARIKAGLHTRPIALGPNSSGWFAHEIDLQLAAAAAGKSEDEIRALVEELHAQRAALFDELLETA